MKAKKYNLQLNVKQVLALYDLMMYEDVADLLLDMSPDDTEDRYNNKKYTVRLVEDLFDAVDICMREAYRSGELK